MHAYSFDLARAGIAGPIQSGRKQRTRTSGRSRIPIAHVILRCTLPVHVNVPGFFSSPASLEAGHVVPVYLYAIYILYIQSPCSYTQIHIALAGRAVAGTPVSCPLDESDRDNNCE